MLVDKKVVNVGAETTPLVFSLCVPLSQVLRGQSTIRYKLENKVCVPERACICPNGHRSHDPACNGELHCIACNQGFLLDGKTCRKACTCAYAVTK